jgi:hypothetical protein
MRWKKNNHKKTRNIFLLYPKSFEGYIYWLCWVTIKTKRLGDAPMCIRVTEIIKIGKTKN